MRRLTCVFRRINDIPGDAGILECFSRLPDSVQTTAKAAYAQWSVNSRHPGLHSKQVRAAGEDVWSVRIGIHWRALAVREGNVLIWFWIGSHADYDRLTG